STPPHPRRRRSPPIHWAARPGPGPAPAPPGPGARPRRPRSPNGGPSAAAPALGVVPLQQPAELSGKPAEPAGRTGGPSPARALRAGGQQLLGIITLELGDRPQALGADAHTEHPAARPHQRQVVPPAESQGVDKLQVG